jgi:hypothetical protein
MTPLLSNCKYKKYSQHKRQAAVKVQRSNYKICGTQINMQLKRGGGYMCSLKFPAGT